MSQYDGVVGIDESALNQFIQTVYAAAHDEILVGNAPVSLPPLEVTSIDYDVASAPQVTLSPSSLVQARFRTMLAAAQAAEDADLDAAAAAAAQASFSLALPSLTLGIHYTDGTVTPIQASVRAGLEVGVEAGGVLTPNLTTLVIDVPADPTLSEIVNHGLAHELISLIDQTFLEPIRIPPLGLGTLQVSPPTVITGEGRLLATTSLAPQVPEPAPTAGPWPSDTLFAAVDDAVLKALLDNVVAGQRIQGSWQKTYNIFVGTVTLHADYDLTVAGAEVKLAPGAGGTLRGTAQVNGTVHVWAKNLFSATGNVTAAAGATVTVSIVNDRNVLVKPDSIDSLHVSVDLHNVPPFLDKAISDFINQLSGPITASVNSAIAAMPAQPLTTIPAIPVIIKGRTLVITAKDLALATIESPDGKSLLALTGAADVQLDPAVQLAQVTLAQPELVGADR